MVASKYFVFWRNNLKHVLARKEIKLVAGGSFNGQTVGVDMSSWFVTDMQHYRDVAFAIGWGNTFYTPVRFMEMIQRRHEALLKANINPIYVLPGRDNPKRIFRLSETNSLEAVGKFYKASRTIQIRSTAQQKAVCSALYMTHTVHPDMIPFLGRWMQAFGVQVLQAPFETCWQLLDLERTGQISGIMSNDATIAMAGADTMLVNAKFKEKKIVTQVFDADRDLRGGTRYQHDFRGLVEYFPEAMTFLGNDYWERTQYSAKKAIREVFPNHILDLQQKAYVNPHFHIAANQLRYGAVVRKNTNDEYAIEPLNPLPENTQWKDAIGFDPVELLPYVSDYGKAMMLQDGQTFTDPETPHPWFQNLRCVMPRKHTDESSSTDDPVSPETTSGEIEVNSDDNKDNTAEKNPQ